ncbi:hypothetical protein SUGI_0540940 [Cryptomeria japonica]|nr:hypothetical protein SUGI_0540940 [Cryptomeria japonica]
MAAYGKPVWIHLYNLPIEYWSEACLEMIGRSFGTLLEIDEEIVEGDLYAYARVIIAAIKATPPSVMFLTANGNWKQHIEIEKEIEGSDDDDLNIVDPRHINQSENIILGREKATRGRKSHKTVREQREKEKGIISMMKFLNPNKGGKASLGGR